MLHWIFIHPIYDLLILLGIAVLVFFFFLLFTSRVFRRDLVNELPLIALGVAILGAAFLIFYFRSAIKNTTTAFLSLPFLHDSTFWGVFFAALAIIALLGAAIYFGVIAPFKFVEDVVDTATHQFSKPIPSSHIYTHSETGTVVEYAIKTRSILGFLGKQTVVESEIEEILDTNPSAQISEYEDTLRIKVISQRRGRGAKSKGGIYS